MGLGSATRQRPADGRATSRWRRVSDSVPTQQPTAPPRLGKDSAASPRHPAARHQEPAHRRLCPATSQRPRRSRLQSRGGGPGEGNPRKRPRQERRYPPSESMLLSAVGGMTDTLHRPSGHLVTRESLHTVCTCNSGLRVTGGHRPPPARQDPAQPAAASVPAGGRTHHGLAPEAAPVLQTQHAAACLVTHRALGAHGQVALQPLVRHGDL